MANVNGNGVPVRTFDVRRDTLDFRDQMYVPTLVEVPSDIPIDDFLGHGVPVLDQGSEGACTGFGLATVANYLLSKRAHIPSRTQVSPRMMYELARRYDEWPGEDYPGSSARGAMKGWNKHGVCAEEDWPYAPGTEGGYSGITEERANAARLRPLGAYFRVNHLDLIAMHSAIAEVGVLYATSMVHDGWNAVPRDGIINQTDRIVGGHAFAIVAYDAEGFWIQNSWGRQWGKSGLGRISYDDWLANGSDVWVARLGAPVMLSRPVSFATAHASKSGQSTAYTYSDLRPHLISLGNEGRLLAGGDYGSTPKEVKHIFDSDFPRLMEKFPKKRLLIFAHGGLTKAESAVQRVAEYRPTLLAAGVYPLAFVWNTDFWTTMTNILRDAVRRRRPEGVLDDTKNFMLDRMDDALEPLARVLTGRAAWREMKENGLAASRRGGGARLVLEHIKTLKENNPDLEIHVVGHSAGAVLQAPLVQLLTSSGKIKGGPMDGEAGMGLKVDSCSLWAPACTIELFKSTYLPAIVSRRIGSFSLFCLSDKAEQDDHCANIYNKSLLYLVSNAFEDKERIPLLRDGVPILGMEKFLRRDPDLAKILSDRLVDLVVAPNNEPADTMMGSEARHHGDFDDDLRTVKSTFQRIAGGPEGKVSQVPIKFEASMDSLLKRRTAIDVQTKLMP